MFLLLCYKLEFSNIQHLHMGHRLQFTALLTYHYPFDVRVIRMLRQKGLGNGAIQLQKKPDRVA